MDIERTVDLITRTASLEVTAEHLDDVAGQIATSYNLILRGDVGVIEGTLLALVDQLAAVRAKNNTLKELLQPLAQLGLTTTLANKDDDYPLFGLNGAMLTVGDVRKARQALAVKEPQ